MSNFDDSEYLNGRNNNWRCRACGLSNQDNWVRCYGCGRENPDMDWQEEADLEKEWRDC